MSKLNGLLDIMGFTIYELMNIIPVKTHSSVFLSSKSRPREIPSRIDQILSLPVGLVLVVSRILVARSLLALPLRRLSLIVFI